jgi:hypothetical protein
VAFVVPCDAGAPVHAQPPKARSPYGDADMWRRIGTTDREYVRFINMTVRCLSFGMPS